MKKIFSLVFSIMLFLTWNGTSLVQAEEFVQDEEVIINEKAIKEESSFREVSGLNSSESHITQVMKDKRNLESKAKYGTYLTESEILEVEKIMEIGDFVPNLRQMIGETEDKPSDVAAFAADHKNGKLFIYLTEGNDRTDGVKNRLLNTFPYPEMLEFKYVKYSHLNLDNLNQTIKLGTNFNDSKIVSKAVNINENKVEIGIYPYSDEVEELLKQKYNDMIMVVPGEYEETESRTKAQSMQGGLQIGSTSARSTGSGYCTLGYTATRGGKKYAVTAGHCLANAMYRGESDWYQGGKKIGYGYSYGDNYNFDAGIIELDSSVVATNKIYKYSSLDSSYTSETKVAPYTGQPVCISGATSGFQCGKVTNPGREVLVTNAITGKNETVNRTGKDYISAGGDSGSPVWYAGVIVGIHTSGGSFTHLFRYKSALGIEAIVK